MLWIPAPRREAFTMSIWTAAKDKRQQRRDEGRNCTAVPALVTQLDTAMKTALGEAANNTNNTYVIAYLASRNQYMAVGIPVPNRATLVQTLNTNLRLNPPLTDPDILWLSRETNLH